MKLHSNIDFKRQLFGIVWEIIFDSNEMTELREKLKCRSFKNVLPLNLLDGAIEDCHAIFTCRSVSADEDYSTGSTYFIKADETPRCLLEHFALNVFQNHTKDLEFDARLVSFSSIF